MDRCNYNSVFIRQRWLTNHLYFSRQVRKCFFWECAVNIYCSYSVSVVYKFTAYQQATVIQVKHYKMSLPCCHMVSGMSLDNFLCPFKDKVCQHFMVAEGFSVNNGNFIAIDLNFSFICFWVKFENLRNIFGDVYA